MSQFESSNVSSNVSRRDVIPGKLESSNVSRRDVGREIGRTFTNSQFTVQQGRVHYRPSQKANKKYNIRSYAILCVCMCMCISIYIYICAYVCVYVYIYIYTFVSRRQKFLPSPGNAAVVSEKKPANIQEDCSAFMSVHCILNNMLFSFNETLYKDNTATPMNQRKHNT